MSIEQEMKAFNYKQIFTALSKLSSRVIHNVQNAATHLVNTAITRNLEQADSLGHVQAQKGVDQKVMQMKKGPQKIDEPKSTLPTPNSR